LICFVFYREGFRKEYKEQHPNVKQVSVVRIDSIRFEILDGRYEFACSDSCAVVDCRLARQVVTDGSPCLML
jgi:hypothetical protein